MTKFVKYAKKFISMFGAFASGCFVAVMIENSCVNWEMILGCGLGLLLAICAGLDEDESGE